MEDGRYNLFIGNITYARDNGVFKCSVKEAGTGQLLFSKVFSLTVLYPPSDPSITPAYVHAVEGKEERIQCSSVGGSPPPEIT